MSFFQTERQKVMTGDRFHRLSVPQLLLYAEHEMSVLVEVMGCERELWRERGYEDGTKLANLLTQCKQCKRQITELKEQCLEQKKGNRAASKSHVNIR